MEKILVIEDDHAVQRALNRMFEGEGYIVKTAADGAGGIQMFREFNPSVVVLDLRLPGIPGAEICRQIAPRHTCPVIVLSAAADVADKVMLLELGADDYVTKPFSPRELLARVRAAVRRSTRPQRSTDVFEFDDVSIDFRTMELKRGTNSVALTAQEFKMLKFFALNPERVISRDELLNEVWGYRNYPTTRTVDNHILRLRQKLEKDPESPIHFRTVHRVGYKFVR